MSESLMYAVLVLLCVFVLAIMSASIWFERRRWDKQRHELMIRLSARDETQAQQALDAEAVRRSIPDKDRAEQENAKTAREVEFVRAYGDDNRFNRHGRGGA